MKKTIAIILGIFLALTFLTACTAKEPETGDVSPSSTVSDSVSEASIPSEVDGFQQFADGLKSLGLEYTETVMAAEMVGAVRGTKYVLADGNIELYLFEEGSAALDQVKANNAITLEGFGQFPAVVNGNYAMMIDEIAQKAEVIDLFNGLK